MRAGGFMLTVLFAGTAWGQSPTPAPAAASRTLNAEGSVRFDPDQALDGDRATAWCGVGAGDWLALYLGEGEVLDAFNGVEVIAGDRRSQSAFSARGTPSAVEIALTVADRQIARSEVECNSDSCQLTLPTAARLGAGPVRLRVTVRKLGSTRPGACIADVLASFTGDPHGAHAAARRFCPRCSPVLVRSARDFDLATGVEDDVFTYQRYRFLDGKWKKGKRTSYNPSE
jgi:hypothetical protein